MKKYKKTMTRDNGLIVQEVWSYAFEGGFEKSTGLKNPHTPSLIYHVKDGATEIWEQEEALSWFKNMLLQLNGTSLNFLEQHLAEYEKLLKIMKPHEQKGILDLKGLKDLVAHLFDASRLFVLLYYSSYDERTPEPIREKALRWRSADELYDTYERVIKDSLTNIFPTARGKELVITIADLDQPPQEKVLQERFDESVFIPGNLVQTISLEDLEARHPDFRFITEAPTADELGGALKGQVASSGNAKGRVRVLRRKSQVADLMEGEILVSPMTTPDFVPAMKKAAAIITDEGGVTCHAAIVSRELKKPCVIGTKVATQIFKDGDIVEVDADKGIIRKL